MSANPDRYVRQRQFAPIGTAGQERIERADVAVLGCGALGSVALELLCRAGVKRLRVIDRDIVEWSNLQRQALFDAQDAKDGRSKTESACQRLALINDQVELTPHVVHVHAGNIDSLLRGCELVIDATDNFATRFLLNDWALSTGTPWVHGGCVGARGQVRLFDGKASPCFRCFLPEGPPTGTIETCDTAGVIGSATAAIASWQVTEALKWLSGNQQAVSSEMLSIDFWHNRVRKIETPRGNENVCRACGERIFEFLNGDSADSGDIALCGRDAVQIQTRHPGTSVDFEAVRTRWESLGDVQANRFFTRLHLADAIQLTLFRDGRVVVHGTQDIDRARTLVDRYVGR